MTLEQRYDELREAWAAGDVVLPNLALALDEIVAESSDQLDDEASRRATKTWGKIEIINALTLDAGGSLSREDIDDVGKLLIELRSVLFGGNARG